LVSALLISIKFADIGHSVIMVTCHTKTRTVDRCVCECFSSIYHNLFWWYSSSGLRMLPHGVPLLGTEYCIYSFGSHRSHIS